MNEYINPYFCVHNLFVVTPRKKTWRASLHVNQFDYLPYEYE